MEKGATRLQAPAATVSDDPRDLGPRIYHFTVIGQALPALAPSLAPSIASDTLVLSAMNGVPWWFSDGIAALGTGRSRASIRRRHRRHDCRPAGSRCVVHASAATAAPASRCTAWDGVLIIGEPRAAVPRG